VPQIMKHARAGRNQAHRVRSTPESDRIKREKIVYTSRFVRVILAQGPC
jgi:hypothetical protein